MNFIKHTNLEGIHAPFGASKSSWLRYDDEKAVTTYRNMKAKEIGTKLHEWAAETINLGIKQSKTKKTLNIASTCILTHCSGRPTVSAV